MVTTGSQALSLSEAGEAAAVEPERVATHAVGVDSHTATMLAAQALKNEVSTRTR